jgi:pimeloyl-ACP methyl ester carboxylesterase/DNA-binding winged helix-turn-helix (wHTH) protein
LRVLPWNRKPLPDERKKHTKRVAARASCGQDNAGLLTEPGITIARVLVFEDFELDQLRFELRRRGDVVHVEPQVYDVLRYLIENSDRVVTKDELMFHVWRDRFVTESSLTTRIKAARRAVDDDGATQRLIRTIHGRGYRFAGDVGIAEAEPEPLEQSVGYCWSDDSRRIAYAVCGQGPPLVKVANWMTHLGNDLRTPVWRHWLVELSRTHQLVRYDEVGCGMSDWDAESYGVDTWQQHLADVVDALRIDRFPLLGISQGGAVGIAYAVSHPERVSHLVLCGAYARGRRRRATTELDLRSAALDVELARVAWGSDDESFMQVFTTQFLPDGTREQWDAFNDLQRRTTSPDNAARFLHAFGDIEVLELAEQIECPTLILHSTGDRRVPMSCAEELAAAIPGSRLVRLGSRNHILTETEPAWSEFLREVRRFLS